MSEKFWFAKLRNSLPLEIPMSESNHMVQRDNKCGLCLLCKKEKRHFNMSGGVRSDSYTSSDAKDAIQYSRASLDNFLSSLMVLENRNQLQNWKHCWLCLD